MIGRINKTRKSFIGAVAMSLVLLLGSALGILIDTKVGQITKPVNSDLWTKYAASSVAVGSGTAEDPYIINSAEELAYLATMNGLQQNFIELNRDLDLGGHEWVPFGTTNFDGCGHTIYNLYMSNPDKAAGFITAFPTYTTIKDLNFSNVNLLGSTASVIVGNPINWTINNVRVLSGRIAATGNAGGLVCGGASVGGITNCINNAEIISYSGNAGGIVANASIPITDCQNYGNVTGYNNAGGIAGNAYLMMTPAAVVIKNCLSEGTITGNFVGGIAGSVGSTIENCGFNGNIKLEPTQDLYGAGSIMGGGYGSSSTATITLTNCYGVADIDIGDLAISTVGTYGASTKYMYGIVQANATVNYSSVYSYSNIVSTSGVKVYRKYKTGADETEPFSEFVYHKNINGGFPFLRSNYAVGQFIDCNVMDFFDEYGFGPFPYDIFNDGTHYYVELGKYPQTYVGDTLNDSLKSWYTSSSPASVDSYTNDTGTSGTITHYAYKYTDGNIYVRVASAITYSSGYKFQDDTTVVVNGSEYWFKVEPIKWWVLNYDAVMNDNANPVILAEQGLTANVTWNKSTSDQNLWSGTCNIRTWLNNTFYNDAFDSKSYIKTTTVGNNNQSSYDDTAGTATQDKVWLLSNNEANGGYLKTKSERLCSPTDYALANKSYLYTSASYPTEIRKNGGTCLFWLRSVNLSESGSARCVNGLGNLGSSTISTTHGAVRPVLTLNI